MLSPHSTKRPAMHLRALFLLSILACHQAIIAASSVTPTTTQRPLYFITNGKRRLSLKYLTKRERIILQQILHKYHQIEDFSPNKKSSSLRKKLLLLLLLLLLAGSLYYVLYHKKKPAQHVQVPQKTQPPIAHPLAQHVAQGLPQASAATLPAALAVPQKQPISDETLMATFSQAIQAMHETADKFKHDSLVPLISSMFHMTQRSEPLINSLHGMMQPPGMHAYGNGYHNTYGSYTQPQYEEPWLATIPRVPQHRPTQNSYYDTTHAPMQAPPRAPISVSNSAMAHALQERLNRIKQ